MKIIALSSALAVAIISTFAISSPAMARDSVSTEQTGHYEWRSAPTYGPKAIPRRVQVWVGPPKMAANCELRLLYDESGSSGSRRLHRNAQIQPIAHQRVSD